MFCKELCNNQLLRGCRILKTCTYECNWFKKCKNPLGLKCKRCNSLYDIDRVNYDIIKEISCVDVFVCQSYLMVLIPLLHFFVGEKQFFTADTKEINYNSNQVARCSRSNQSGTNIKMKTVQK
jgi:hypothetical protein